MEVFLLFHILLKGFIDQSCKMANDVIEASFGQGKPAKKYFLRVEDGNPCRSHPTPLGDVRGLFFGLCPKGTKEPKGAFCWLRCSARAVVVHLYVIKDL